MRSMWRKPFSCPATDRGITIRQEVQFELQIRGGNNGVMFTVEHRIFERESVPGCPKGFFLSL